jgi:ABC-type Fe3+-siderophore transport system permease subunit
MTRKFLTLALISAVAGTVSLVLHTCLGDLLQAEERLFLLIAVVVAPLGLVVGLVGAAVCVVVIWRRRAHRA